MKVYRKLLKKLKKTVRYLRRIIENFSKIFENELKGRRNSKRKTFNNNKMLLTFWAAAYKKYFADGSISFMLFT